MKQNNLAKLLGIALVVAIIATGVFYGLFVNKLSSSTGSGKMVVVAAKPIPAGTVLAETDVQSIPWPVDGTPAGAFDNAQQLAGRTVLVPLAQGEPVLAARLASTDKGGGGSGVPAGMRAVSVHVTDSSGVLAQLGPGQKVDVQVLVTRKSTNGEPELRTVLEGISVLSVNPQPEATSQGSNLPAVTLLTNPADADVLALADSGARVRLALRNPLDNATRPRTAMTLDTILRASDAAAKAR
ncbi:MAG TPA: Flp pilus assembly protein CpaB [Candidatus Sulfopaludibacter sp.]|nr:Flp pilus assembly protein CpaB [Candidatus Sulfopaludibacter sp.]